MLIDLIKTALEGALPGSEGQMLMAPSSRFTGNKPPQKSAARESSVLILLFPIDNVWHFPLIRRTEYNGVHSGQISLPGGKCEKEDANYWGTATRETYEEIGVDPESIRPLGALSPLYIPNSNFYVFPQVGWLPQMPILKAEPAEVDAIIEMPVARLVESTSPREFKKDINGISLTAPYYEVDGHKVWGATAMILSEFVESMRRTRESITASHFYNARNVQGYP